MSSRLPLGRFVVCCLSLTLPAAAQLDSSALRAKYGSPINREIFYLPAGFDLTVDYGAGNQVCKLEVPALMPTNDTVYRASDQRQRMYDFLAELVPGSMRGKEGTRFTTIFGAISFSYVEYEYVMTIETNYADQPDRGRITVRFLNENCQAPNGQ